jgi:hypothetical protein
MNTITQDNINNAVEERPSYINQYELKAVSAVVAYVAHTQEVSEATVSSLLAATFGVDEIRALSPEYYDDAIRFLIDLHCDEFIN